MSSTDVPGSPRVDMALETVVIAVSDVDAAKAFYEGLGWRLDADLGDADFRIVQFNPPGSDCSIQFGAGLTSAAPGSALNLLVVSDIEAAHDELVAHGVDAEVFHDSSVGYNRFDPSVRARRVPTRNERRTRRSPSSAIPTGTSGSCRRSPVACPVASTRPARPSPPSTTWPGR